MNTPAPAQEEGFGSINGAVELAGDSMRASLYGLLAALLAAPPSAQLLELIRALEEDGGSGAGDLAEAWRTLSAAAREAVIEDLDDEYHALFIGLGRGEVVPFGSWYLTGYLMDRPLAYLRRDLGDLGIVRQERVGDPEDHAAAICESMRLIITAGDIAPDWQSRFYETHVGTWMRVFFQDLQQAPSASFYAAVAGLGRAFLQFEERYLSLPQ